MTDLDPERAGQTFWRFVNDNYKGVALVIASAAFAISAAVLVTLGQILEELIAAKPPGQQVVGGLTSARSFITWLVSADGGTWATVFVASVAGYFAYRSWRASEDTLRASFRPVLRPVPVLLGGGKLGYESNDFLIKNYGTGPAFGVRLVGRCGSVLDYQLGMCDVIEPLGPRHEHKEWTRVGRRHLQSLAPFETGDNYRLLYQDVNGTWHETRFVPNGVGFEVRYLGEIAEIPIQLRESGMVVYGEFTD